MIVAFLLSLTAVSNGTPGVPVGTCGRYLVLTGNPETEPSFDSVDITFGPTVNGGTEGSLRWWQVEVFAKEETAPLFQWRILTEGNPLEKPDTRPVFHQYLLRTPDMPRPVSYRNVHTGKAFLPTWKDFEEYFVPHRTHRTGEREGFPNTVRYLGNTLTLTEVVQNGTWEEWEDVTVLDLDPELLIGTGRNIRNAHPGRVPTGEDYRYTVFTPEDYDLMIETGFNLFTIAAEQRALVQDRPVFYIMPVIPRRPPGEPAVRYPADLYRSNYLGTTMFMDEPTMRLSGDKFVNTRLRYFTDFAEVIRQRVRSRYLNDGHYGAFLFEGELKRAGANLGDMRIMQHDYPSWETARETTFYQMAGGCAGLVHEGRYQLAELTEGMNRWTGTEREYTPEEYLRYEYAFLRGGTRPFGKFWGTSIYGQADPEINPLAVTLAYDMGARYIWFWTSDHDHHLPWEEQIELVRIIRSHAESNPRPSIMEPLPERDLVIAIPYGYFLTLPHGNDNIHAQLWWIRELDPEKRNESSKAYARLMERAHLAVIEAFERGHDFDITVDDGREISGYRRVEKVGAGE